MAASFEERDISREIASASPKRKQENTEGREKYRDQGRGHGLSLWSGKESSHGNGGLSKHTTRRDRREKARECVLERETEGFMAACSTKKKAAAFGCCLCGPVRKTGGCGRLVMFGSDGEKEVVDQKGAVTRWRGYTSFPASEGGSW